MLRELGVALTPSSTEEKQDAVGGNWRRSHATRFERRRCYSIGTILSWAGVGDEGSIAG